MKIRVITLSILLCFLLCACGSVSEPITTEPATTVPNETAPAPTNPVTPTDPETGAPSLTVAPEDPVDIEDLFEDIFGGGGVVLPEDEFSEDEMGPMVTTPSTTTSSNVPTATEPETTEAPTEAPQSTESTNGSDPVATLPEDVFE